MKISVRMFAIARQLAGAEVVELEIPEPVTVKDLRRALAAQIPALAPLMAHLMIAVDNDYATDGTSLCESSEVACIPPVSGG